MPSTLRALLRLPLMVAALWSGIAEAEIVHAGIAGWPFPSGWIANPIALLLGRKLVIVVESATWRLSGSSQDNWKRWIRHHVSNALGRFFCNHAHLTLFTQPDYQRSLLTAAHGPSFVTPATWINEDDILDREAAHRIWSKKSKEPVRLLFAGRMTADKGVELLLETLKSIDHEEFPLEVDLIGEGPLRERCVEFAASAKRPIRVLDPVPYGEQFFNLLHRYHAVVVPSLSDEQPRIVFDAFAQACPVIVADTDGLRPHVAQASTGWRVTKGDAQAWADALRQASGAAAELRKMGMAALDFAPKLTHRGMHRRRWRILAQCFGTSSKSRRRGRTPKS